MRIVAGRIRPFAVGLTAATILLGLHARGRVEAVAQGTAAQGSQAETAPPKPTGIVLGQVVDAAGGKPVAGATVTINGGLSGAVNPLAAAAPTAAPTAPRQVMTSGSGLFMFRDLSKGRYTIRVTSPGYLAGSYGQNKPGGALQTIELLQDDERRGDLIVRLWRGASLSGTLVDESGEPVVGYQVRTIRKVMVAGKVRLNTSSSATTDDRGFYRISSLTPGDYLVAVMSTQTTIPVATADVYAQVMSSGASSLDNPATRQLSNSNAPYPMGGGYRVGDLILSTSEFGMAGGAPPAPDDDGKVAIYPTQFYPASRLASQATTITLGSGQDRTGVDFQLKLMTAVRVSGLVLGPSGPAGNLGLRLYAAGADDFASDFGRDNLEAAVTVTDPSGAFTFLGVTPGEYTLKCLLVPRPQVASSPANRTSIEISGPNGMMMGIMSAGGPTAGPPPPLPTEPTLWATIPVSVADTGVTGLQVSLRTGARIAGRIAFEGTHDPPAPDQLQRASIEIYPASGPQPFQISGAAKRVETDGRFSSVGYPPGRYNVTASVPSTPNAAGVPGSMTNWTLKSATVGGHDVSDEGLDVGGEDVAGLVITFTDRQTELTGTVRDGRGQPDASASVFILPADSQAWRQGVLNARRLRNVRTTTTGAFSVAGLPSGEYLVAAVKEDTIVEWQDPKFLEKVAAVAVHVTIGDGEKKSQELATKTIR